MTGSRTLYTRSPAEGPKGIDVITCANTPSARQAHMAGDKSWKRADIRAGDWVYMPQKWWHQVYAAKESVMLSIYAETPEPVEVR